MNVRPAALASIPIVAVLALAAFAQNEGPKPQMLKINAKMLVTPEELKWTPLAGIPGAEVAQLVGDPAKEAHRAFFKYPVGLKSPPHTHTFGDRGVIVSGMLSLAVDGAPAKKLAPGSFFSIPAGTPHITTVEGDKPCVFFMEREGMFDVVAVEAGAKKQ